jgi:hypothetical protein
METLVNVVRDGENMMETATITHNGNEYTAGGAMVTETHAVGYLARRVGFGKSDYIITDWQGNEMGAAMIVAHWKINSYLSDCMMQVEARIGGRWYTGRSTGEGMLWRGKVMRNQ